MGAESVKVVVRCRPMNGTERGAGRVRVVEMDPGGGQVLVRDPKGAAGEPPKAFTFDMVYNWESTQKQVYDNTARGIVNSTMEGYNGTIFAYGQTGTGKSHTMEGQREPQDLWGIIPRSFNHIFDAIDGAEDTDFLVRASYLEIYNEDVRDLLAKNAHNKLELKESVDTGVYVKDLTAFVVKNVAEITNVLNVGQKNRSVGATKMNLNSSRSHSIFTITVEQSSRGADGHIRVGKLNLVDLAGSERQSKTGATGERLKEATKINLSLSALGNVISALVDGKSGHIPYRDSKLTRLLQDSLGGNTKTLMIANLGPADYNYDETLSTLRYANRAKNIKNKPKINEDPKDAMLREFQDEIKRLKAQLNEPSKVEKVVERDASAETVEAMKKQLRSHMVQSLRKNKGDATLDALKAKAEKEAMKSMEEYLSKHREVEQEKGALVQAIQATAAEMDSQAEALEKERVAREEMENKLKAMEGRVLHGGVNLLERQEEIEAEAQRNEAEIARRKAEEREQRRRILELEEAQLMVDDHYKSVEEEVEVKSDKLKRLNSNYARARKEVKDIAGEFQRDREDLLDTIRSLTRQIKLKDAVIAGCIPPQYQEKIMKHTHYDEAEELWHIECNHLCGAATRARREAQAEGGLVGGGGLDDSFDHAFEAGHAAQPVSDKLQNVFFSYKQATAQLAEAEGIEP